VNFKLILALVDQTKVDPILKAAREAGATGATVITSARGEGLVPKKTFPGLDLAAQRDVVLLAVEEHLCPGCSRTWPVPAVWILSVGRGSRSS
jgi:hypothetical protein